jgi:ribose transport system ATP-binding protein
LHALKLVFQAPHAEPAADVGHDRREDILVDPEVEEQPLIPTVFRDIPEPDAGIDVGTKAEIYKLINEAADQGLAILLVSSEMPELLALSDRILVMGEGVIKGELRGSEMNQTNILTLATDESASASTAH